MLGFSSISETTLSEAPGLGIGLTMIAAIGELGSLIAASPAIYLTGVSSIGVLGSILVWGQVPPGPSGSWVNVAAGPGGGWTNVAAGAVANWTVVVT